MLDKTMELLKQILPGTFVSDSSRVFVEDEIRELASKLQAMVYAPAVLRARLQDYGICLTPSNFYSEVPSIAEIEEEAGYTRSMYAWGFDLEKQLKTLYELLPFSQEFDPPSETTAEGFTWDNDQFSYSDAMAYYCFIRSRRPRNIVEIGSGWSSLVAAMALRRNGEGRLTCIEPFPSERLRSITGLNLIQRRAQDLQADALNEIIGDGDILFIDSTHTVKHNSDCLHIYLRLLPEITSSILVHAHDIRLPETLSLEMMRDKQIYWTEQYLLYAYLLDNPRCRTLFGSAFLNGAAKDRLSALMHGRWAAGGASLWFDQTARQAE